MMNPPQKVVLNVRFVLFASAVTAIGGFLFGYDTAVINGANTFLQTHFKLDPKTDSLLIGLATASAIIGCIPGAMSAGFISDKFGRRRVLFGCAFLYALSGILSAIPQSFVQFIAARVLSGIAIGVSSMICPVYIAELAPAAWRGRMGTLFQLGIVTGIFVTLFINGMIQGLGDAVWNTAYGWRWMLAAEALPAFLFFFLLFPIPESPKWLVQANREGEARKTLERIGDAAYADAEVAAVKEVLQQKEGSFAELFSRRYHLPLLLAFVLMFGAQFSGINAIMYYSTNIFLNAAGIGQVASRVADFRGSLTDAQSVDRLADGQQMIETALAALRSEELKPILDASAAANLEVSLRRGNNATTTDELKAAATAALTFANEGRMKKAMDEVEQQAKAKAFTCSVWIGLVNLLATFIATLLVDKAGRKPLLLIGNAVQVLALGTVGYLYHIQSQSTGLLLGFVILYTAAFATAMGPLPWIVCSEIFPAKLRGRAMSVATFCIWTGCLIVAQTFPFLLKHIGSSRTFWIYGACSAATLLLVFLLLPETKGKSLEQIEKSWGEALKL